MTWLLIRPVSFGLFSRLRPRSCNFQVSILFIFLSSSLSNHPPSPHIIRSPSIAPFLSANPGPPALLPLVATATYQLLHPVLYLCDTLASRQQFSSEEGHNKMAETSVKPTETRLIPDSQEYNDSGRGSLRI